MFGVNSAGAVKSEIGVLDTGTWEWSNQYISTYPTEEDNSSSESSGGLSSGAIAGIVIGCVAAIVSCFSHYAMKKENERKPDV